MWPPPTSLSIDQLDYRLLTILAVIRKSSGHTPTLWFQYVLSCKYDFVNHRVLGKWLARPPFPFFPTYPRAFSNVSLKLVEHCFHWLMSVFPLAFFALTLAFFARRVRQTHVTPCPDAKPNAVSLLCRPRHELAHYI